MNNHIIVVLGRKGSGKTYYAKYRVRGATRVLFYDPMRQFSECGVIVNEALTFLEYLEKNQSGVFRVVYQPELDIEDEDGLQREFLTACKIANCLSNYWLVLDEIDQYASDRKKGNILKNLINRGRHYGASILATTIRYTDTGRSLTAQADEIISFNTHEPRDVEYLRAYFGPLADDLNKLKPYHYIRYTEGKAEKLPPLPFPAA